IMIERVIISALAIGIVAFFLFQWLLNQGYTVDEARNGTLLLMVLFENIHVFNCRSEYKSAFKIPVKNNILLITGVIIAQALHIVSMNIPIMQDVLNIEPIKIQEWLYLLVLSGSILVIMEVFKLFKFKKI
ncbi:MAG: cation transporting ATPase C-terminal domain-containing protein, partial [Candidatus Aenigmarchaeota archaeon]|nr:cation transporting ATPase C-terminal domain-containing protein [Candidatus Aenigmarchaeota archaeon]